MLGTMVNVFAIIIGSFAGILIKGGVPERFNDTVMKGLALCVVYIGVSGSLKSENDLLLIISIVMGGIIGELIDIDRWLQRLGNGIEARLKGRGGKVAEGFVTASLIYCIGSMAILGSLESGLTGNHKILFTKSVIDGISSVIFASTMGIGVMLSAVSVFIYQGVITSAAFLLKDILTAGGLVNNMTAVGSLLIVGIGINMLGFTKIKTANLLPAIFIPIIYQVILNIFA